MPNNSRRALLVLLVLLMVIPTIGCKTRRKRASGQSTPAPFSAFKSVSPDGLFTVMMPTEPKVDKQVLHKRDRISYGASTRNEFYRVTVFVTRDDAMAAKAAADKDTLKKYADTWSKTGQTECKVDGQPGLEVKWTEAAPGKHSYRGRVVQSPDGHLVYLFRARWLGPTEPPNVAQFLDSFKLGKYTPPVGASPAATPSAAPSEAPSAAPSGEASPSASESGEPEEDNTNDGDIKDKPEPEASEQPEDGGNEEE